VGLIVWKLDNVTHERPLTADNGAESCIPGCFYDSHGSNLSAMSHLFN
jgi:hypothetical protein